jgi:phosphohistidine phosphatase
MEFYLMRHSTAEAGDVEDADRPLTGEGKEKLAAMAAFAKGAGVEPELVLSSPFRRASDTADAMAAELGGERVDLKELEPDGVAPTAWRDIVEASEGKDCVLAVSHEPLISKLVNWTLAANEIEMEFKQGAIMRIDFDDPSKPGILRWMVTPKLAMRTAGSED